MMRRRFALTMAFTAAVVTLGLGGCSGESPEHPDGRNSGAAPSSSGKPTDETPSAEETELLARVISGDAPSDLIWQIPTTLPEGWKEMPLEDQQDTVQFSPSPACLVTFYQPSGLGDADAPDSATVAHDYSTVVGQTVGSDIDVSLTDEISLDADVNDGTLTTQLTFAREQFAITNMSGASGVTYAYRGGDFALIAYAACGEGGLAEKSEEIQGFIESATPMIRFE